MASGHWQVARAAFIIVASIQRTTSPSNMGRITVYKEEGCVHGKRFERAFKSHLLPYTVISLSAYPEKRSDLMRLTMQISSPFVFFNTRFIGGADEALALLQEWDDSCDSSTSSSTGSTTMSSSCSISSHGSKLVRRKVPRRSSLRRKCNAYSSVLERYMAEVGLHPDPVDQLLAIPSTPPFRPEPSPKRVESDVNCIRVKKGKATSVLEMTELLKSHTKLNEDNRVNGIVYKRSFFGRQVLILVREAFDLTNKETAVLVEQLIDLQIIDLLEETRVGASTKSDPKARLYRLHCYHTPDVLNSYRVWTERTDTNSMRLLDGLFGMMLSIEVKVTNELGFKDLERAQHLPQFIAFEEAICELQGVDLVLMDDVTKLAFGMNLYNLMIQYARIKVGVVPGDNSVVRSTFFATVKFNIGGHLYTFNDWEHGILRGNSKSINSFAITSPFNRKDPRLQFIVNTVEPRIHFGLSRGSRSCPKFCRFSAEFLNEELTIAAANFCNDESNVKVNIDKREISLSQTFRWYRPDFTDGERDVPTVINRYVKGLQKQTLDRLLGDCHDAPITLVYLPFDWSSFGCMNSNTFDTKLLKMEHKQGIRGLLRGTSRMSPRRAISSKEPIPTPVVNPSFVLFHY